MPSHAIHRAFTDMVFGTGTGDRYAWVDQYMDITAPIHGPSHRNDLVHNPIFIYALSGGDPKALAVAMCHTLLDRADTALKHTISSVTETKKPSAKPKVRKKSKREV